MTNIKKIGIIGATINIDTIASAKKKGINVVVVTKPRSGKKFEFEKSTAVMKVYLNQESEPEKSFCIDRDKKIVDSVPLEKGFLIGYKVANKNIRVGFILTLHKGKERFSLKSRVIKTEEISAVTSPIS